MTSQRFTEQLQFPKVTDLVSEVELRLTPNSQSPVFCYISADESHQPSGHWMMYRHRQVPSTWLHEYLLDCIGEGEFLA